MKLILEVINENDFQQKDFQLDRKSATIGRSLESDWQLSDESNFISGKHLFIEFRDNLYFIKDISTNGTYLKNPYRKLPKEMPIKINSMDVFIIGNYEVQARFIEDKISYKNMSEYNHLLSNQKGISSSIIPDDDFLLEDDEIMDNTFVKKESIQSFQNIVKLYEDKDSKLIDEINNDVIVVEDSFDNETRSLNSLYQHINIPKFNNSSKEEIIYEVQEVKNSYAPTNVSEDNSLIYLENKLGISLRGLSSFDREKVLTQIADIVISSLEGLKTSLNIKDKILDDLNIENLNPNSINFNPIRKGKEALETIVTSSIETISISEALKKSFSEIDNHNVALHRASRSLVSKTLEEFSPKFLEERFDKSYDFITLKPKKFQMWDAYVSMYHKLSKQDNFMLDSVQKDFADEYNNTIFTIKLTSI